MTWLHQCRLPGNFRIWLHRARAEAQYTCGCGRTYTLERRVVEGTGYAFWRWSPPGEYDESQSEMRGNVYSTAEVAYREDARDDSERRIPDVQIGFRSNDA